jgi:hypothetical protein
MQDLLREAQKAWTVFFRSDSLTLSSQFPQGTVLVGIRVFHIPAPFCAKMALVDCSSFMFIFEARADICQNSN